MNEKIQFIAGGTITSPAGFTAGAAYGGINKHARFNLDVGLLLSQNVCSAAGVFTRNQVKSAPVLLCQNRLPSSCARAVIVNSGCANASTGARGMEDAISMAEAAAEKTGTNPRAVMVASTGIIGRRLPIDLVHQAVKGIELTKEGGHDMARAIMTTDTVPKEAAVKAGGLTIGGIAKGAGMIHPDMATMLCFIATDAAADSEFLDAALRRAADKSFNMISVDGDTSPNDSILLLANGASGMTAASENEDFFQRALDAVCIHLAKAIARDGEGATRLIEVTVRGAASLFDARHAARTIVSSNLVKTAIHGGDPNWGRIIAAAGRSQAHVEESRLALSICGVPVMKDGAPLVFDATFLSSLIKQNEVIIDLDLNLGQNTSTAWGCDLSAEYVSINADYTT